jgi:hypothetical protein
MAEDVIETALRAARGGKKKTKTHRGPIHSTVAGRTDHLPMHVASGSYVIPADIISAMGEGNSMAGFKVAKSIFSIPGPYGQGDGLPYGGGEMPYDQPSPRKRASGGSTPSGGNPKASAAIAAGNQQVAANRAASAMYAQQANARDGSPIPSHLRGYGGGQGGGSGPSVPRGGTGSFGLPNPAGGSISSVFGVRGPADFIDGGGLGASGDKFHGGLISGAMNLLGVTPYARSTGGRAEDHDAVPIVAAGGEYVIAPDEVAHIGGGSLDDGHKILDAFVKKMRKKTIRTLQSLPGPKKD